MKITLDSHSTVTRHTRTVQLEDGPVISAGPDYYDGTFFRIEKVRSVWLEGEQPSALRVSGKRCDEQGNPKHDGGYWHTHERGLFVSELEDLGLHDIAAMFNTEEG
ncbi:hypothetical protein SEA_WYBORN_59 [Arthrobacter phage Wyborn]|uniref:Uncharacterized protein n=1 Tax=Arthrobacter phage Wyborn TaxID=3059067 RepID=A0AA96GZW2_9CAUD|nr:hypothetical protein SEA_WYBORN_59 [Arthrobacter phage Wyborn]